MKFLLLLAVPFALCSCSRHVVVEPERVWSLNDRSWTVHGEPTERSDESAAEEAAP